MKIIKQDIKPTRAFANYQEIRGAAHAMASNILELGRLFYDNYTNKYYTVLGYSSWREFLGDPDIGYAESTVRSFVHIYKKYVLKLAVAPKLLMEIGHGKLQIISPVVESDPDMWLGQARALSKSDLIIEVRGEPPPVAMERGGNCLANAPHLPLTPDEYVALVKSSPCCVCEKMDEGGSVAHHHPRKRVRGVWWHVVPLCHECHALYHAQESVYKHDWAPKMFGWLFDLVVKEK